METSDDEKSEDVDAASAASAAAWDSPKACGHLKRQVEWRAVATSKGKWGKIWALQYTQHRTTRPSAAVAFMRCPRVATPRMCDVDVSAVYNTVARAIAYSSVRLYIIPCDFTTMCDAIPGEFIEIRNPLRKQKSCPAMSHTS